jgi:hypothetical protein
MNTSSHPECPPIPRGHERIFNTTWPPWADWNPRKCVHEGVVRTTTICPLYGKLSHDLDAVQSSAVPWFRPVNPAWKTRSKGMATSKACSSVVRDMHCSIDHVSNDTIDRTTQCITCIRNHSPRVHSLRCRKHSAQCAWTLQFLRMSLHTAIPDPTTLLSNRYCRTRVEEGLYLPPRS